MKWYEDVEVVAEDEVVVDDVVVDDEVVVDEVVEEDITGVGSLATLTSPAPTPAHAEASDARASRADTFRRQNADLTHATVHRYAVAATS